MWHCVASKWFSGFSRIVVPSSSRVTQTKKCNPILWNAGNHVPYTVSLLKKTEVLNHTTVRTSKSCMWNPTKPSNIWYVHFFRCLMSVACKANGYVTCQYVHIYWVYLKTLLLTCSYSVLKTLHINFCFIKWTAIFKYIHLIHFSPLRMKINLNYTKTFNLYHTVNTASVHYHSQVLT